MWYNTLATIKEHARIVLTSDLPEQGLKGGDMGTVVHVYERGQAYEVEFLTLDGDTVAIATLLRTQVRPVGKREITHARQLAER